MAFVKKTDLVPDFQMVADAVAGYVAAGLPVMGGTGAAVISTGLPSNVAGTTVTVPYFGSLGEAEDISTDSDALTPAAFVSTDETDTVVHTGKAFEITKWAQNAIGGINEELARQIKETLVRRFDKALIDRAKRNTSNEWDSYVYDGTASTITYDSIVNARMTLGDESGEYAAIVMHSKVAKDLLLLKHTTGIPVFVDATTGSLSSVAGIPVVISDRLTPDGSDYTSLLVKRGSLALWIADFSEENVVKDFNVLRHTDVAAVHAYFVAHRYYRMPGMSKPGVVHLKTK